MDRISVLGVDLAKNVFQVHGVSDVGQVVVRRKLSREGFKKYMAKLEPCLVGMEATSGSRHWQREFKKLGHDARLIAPQFVKPFVKSDKNDANDAEAICEAVQRPNMRFVGEKTLEQQEIQMLHRMRSGLVAHRTEICNEIRAVLADFEVVASQGLARLREKVLEVTSVEGSPVSDVGKWLLTSLLEQWRACNEHLAKMDEQLETVFNKYEVCRRLVTIPGVGPITATAIVGSVPNINGFKSGRHLSAWLDLCQNKTPAAVSNAFRVSPNEGTRTCASYSSTEVERSCAVRGKRRINEVSGSPPKQKPEVKIKPRSQWRIRMPE